MNLPLKLDLSRAFQTLEGIGASLAWSGDPVGETWSEAARSRLADALFCPERGAGLSGVRLNIGSGAAWTEESPSDPWRHSPCYKKTADAPFDPSVHRGQEWFVRAAKERGASCRVAFANSPPIWLTRNGRGTHDPSQKTDTSNLIPGAEGAFSEFLADVVAHFEEIGLPFTALSPVNEPQWAWEEGSQEGCRFNNAEILALAEELRAELDRRGLPIEIDLPEAADLRFLIDDDLLEKPYIHGNEAAGWGKSREQVRELHAHSEGKICGHGYWTYDPVEKSRELREAVRETMRRHLPDGRFWQSEVCIMEPGRDLGIDTALRVARMAHQDFVHADASAWFWWIAISPYDYKDGLVYLDGQDLTDETFHVSKTLWALGNFSRFARPGWRRISVTPTEDDGLYVSAWQDPESGKLALVAVNTSEIERTLTVHGLGAVTPYVTDAARDLEPGAPLPAGETLTAGPRSITTWVG